MRICWSTKTTPWTWHTAKVIPVYKKGSPYSCENYRPISLVCIFTADAAASQDEAKSSAAGAVVGVLFGIAMLAGIGYVVFLRRSKKNTLDDLKRTRHLSVSKPQKGSGRKAFVANAKFKKGGATTAETTFVDFGSAYDEIADDDGDAQAAAAAAYDEIEEGGAAQKQTGGGGIKRGNRKPSVYNGFNEDGADAAYDEIPENGSAAAGPGGSFSQYDEVEEFDAATAVPYDELDEYVNMTRLALMKACKERGLLSLLSKGKTKKDEGEMRTVLRAADARDANYVPEAENPHDAYDMPTITVVQGQSARSNPTPRGSVGVLRQLFNDNGEQGIDL
jgi:hypothetical protein